MPEDNRQFANYCIREATVMTCVPALQFYLVYVEYLGDKKYAVPLYTGSSLYGSRSYTTYGSGTRVLVLCPPEMESPDGVGERGPCYILGTLPYAANNDVDLQADSSHFESRVSWLFDEVHTRDNRELKDRIDRKNFNAYQPIDGLSGEWGQFSPMGPALFQGLLFSFLRASDRCGVWAFHQDDMLRLLAKNYQHLTFNRESEETAVSGELLINEGLAMYPWEGLGSFSDDTSVAAIDGLGEAYDEEDPKKKSSLAPAEDNQRAIFRSRRLGGYLADLDQQFVALPQGSGIDKYGENEDQFPGVFRKAIGPDGSYLVQTAKSLTLEKTLLIPYPIELKKPHDPTGQLNPAEDETDEGGEGSSYFASGIYKIDRDGGDDEVSEPVRQEFNGLDGEETAASRHMLGLELHGFMARESIKNLLRQDLNWKTPEEMDASAMLDEGESPINIGPEFQLDPNKQYMPLPRAKELAVDHRYPVAKYYASRSALRMLDDGTVLIEDGYGSQIIMSGGNITQACANDIVEAPGRSKVTMAPKDIIQRAGRDVDVTSSYGDVRLKAEYSLMAIGGNDGEKGGVLIESRNQSPTSTFDYQAGVDADIQGLVLANRRGNLALIGQNLSVLAGVDDEISGNSNILIETPGSVYEAGKNKQAIYTSAIEFLLGDPDNDPEVDLEPGELGGRTVMRFDSTGPSFIADDDLTMILSGSIFMQGGITTSGVAEVDQNELNSQFADIVETYQTIAQTGLTQLTVLRYGGDGGDNGDLNLDYNSYFNILQAFEVQGSLRTPEQYNTDEEENFLIHEFLWQQMAKATGNVSATQVWAETVVEFVSGEETVETMPWPGTDPWLNESRLITVKDGEDTNFDYATGRARAYDPETDESATGPGTTIPIDKMTLSDNFLVNFVPTER